VIAAAKQMVPPSTAAGTEADIRRETLREIDELEVRKDQTHASIHKATIPVKDPTIVHSHQFQRHDFLGNNRYAATKTANHGRKKGELTMQIIKARPDETTILMLSDNTEWLRSFKPISPKAVKLNQKENKPAKKSTVRRKIRSPYVLSPCPFAGASLPRRFIILCLKWKTFSSGILFSNAWTYIAFPRFFDLKIGNQKPLDSTRIVDLCPSLAIAEVRQNCMLPSKRN